MTYVPVAAPLEAHGRVRRLAHAERGHRCPAVAAPQDDALRIVAKGEKEDAPPWVQNPPACAADRSGDCCPAKTTRCTAPMRK